VTSLDSVWFDALSSPAAASSSRRGDSVRSGGFPLIQRVPDLGHVPRQQLVHLSDRVISDSGQDPAQIIQAGGAPIVRANRSVALSRSEQVKDHADRRSAFHVRRDKVALLQRVQAPLGNRSSRKRPEQAWR
jgi:hypothetical protein